MACKCQHSAPTLSSLTSILRPLSDGDRGISETIGYIRKMAEQGRNDFIINQAAGGIVRQIAPQKLEDRARAIFNAVLRRVKFVEDIVDGETIRPAAVIWQQGFGDCDDINGILLPSLFMTVGYPVRLVTVAVDPGDLSQFSHIYSEVQINGKWIPADAARPGARWAREPETPARKHIWNLLDGEDYEVHLGQNESIADTLAVEVPSIESGAAEIVQAATGNYPAATQPTSASVFLSWPVLLLLGLGAVAIAFSGRRR